ncbi:MAG: class I SAM-dependent methyltransferase [Sulfuritalea sp.]|nr:class I SAM-dependent methyltransferase [Sulfuritalea sp.]
MSNGESGLSQQRQELLKRVLPAESVIERDAVRVGGAECRVRDGIVRFRDDDGYASSFALQWGRFQLEQYDSTNGTQLYGRRFARETGWPDHGLEGELILEAGCGAGAFSLHLLRTGANLVSFDYSSAVEVAAAHNPDGRAVFCQADILAMPFRDGAFDRVFCHGVLQHTPDPKASFMALCRVLRPGGRLSIDVYKRDWRIRPWKSKRLWRWLTVRMDQGNLLRFLEWFIPKWLPIDTALKSVPFFGNYLGAVVPCWNYFRRPELSKQQQRAWAIMDTFDALAPRYDIPASLGEVRSWFSEAGFKDFEVREGGNGVVGNGTKP